MSLHVLTGLPGSGKSNRLIELVNSGVSRGQSICTFACRESPILARRELLRIYRLLGCRRPGVTCPLHHFVSTAESAAILSRLSSGMLAAFEEAQFFGAEIVTHWIEASRRGVEIIVSTPSKPQLQLLKHHPFTETVFKIQCQKCGKTEASTFVAMPEPEMTMALCSQCSDEMTEAARLDLLERLQRQPPHPGEKALYEPVKELRDCARWKIVRSDSKVRVNLMAYLIREMGLPEAVAPDPATYLDLGCSTGYFCDRIRRLGFCAEGVDVVKADIDVAKILDSYFRKGHTRYVTQDTYTYLHDSQERLFDVTSAFSVFQWLMIQTTVERRINCLEWLFAKTKRLCFLEMGYSAESKYKQRLKANIHREWVRRIMEEKGGFSEIRVFDSKEHGLMSGRDLFVGIKPSKPLLPQIAID